LSQTSHVAQPVIVAPHRGPSTPTKHASPTFFAGVQGELSPFGQYSPAPHPHGVNGSFSAPPGLQGPPPHAGSGPPYGVQTPERHCAPPAHNEVHGSPIAGAATHVYVCTSHATVGPLHVAYMHDSPSFANGVQ
jgi:hypothetical protein